eukprot:747976-Hanusia_phi.AAC.1
MSKQMTLLFLALVVESSGFSYAPFLPSSSLAAVKSCRTPALRSRALLRMQANQPEEEGKDDPYAVKPQVARVSSLASSTAPSPPPFVHRRGLTSFCSFPAPPLPFPSFYVLLTGSLFLPPPQTPSFASTENQWAKDLEVGEEAGDKNKKIVAITTGAVALVSARRQQVFAITSVCYYKCLLYLLLHYLSACARAYLAGITPVEP